MRTPNYLMYYNSESGKHEPYETQTSSYLAGFDKFNATDFIMGLNKGQGFDGWTPKFFLERFIPKS